MESAERLWLSVNHGRFELEPAVGVSKNLLRDPDRALRCAAMHSYASAPRARCGPLATVFRSSPSTAPCVGAGFRAEVAGKAHGCWGMVEIGTSKNYLIRDQPRCLRKRQNALIPNPSPGGRREQNPLPPGEGRVRARACSSASALCVLEGFKKFQGAVGQDLMPPLYLIGRPSPSVGPAPTAPSKPDSLLDPSRSYFPPVC